jgi:hypothetical protein
MMYQPTIATAFLMASHDFAFFYVSISNNSNSQQSINITSITVSAVASENGANCTGHVMAAPDLSLALTPEQEAAHGADEFNDDLLKRTRRRSDDDSLASRHRPDPVNGYSALRLFARLAQDATLGPNGGIIQPGVCCSLLLFYAFLRLIFFCFLFVCFLSLSCLHIRCATS